MAVQDQIEHYGEHLEDQAYIDAILKSAQPETLYNILDQMLRSGDQVCILAADLFLRDVMLLARAETAAPFREGFSTSVIVDTLQHNVFAGYYTVRRDAVYTIGKCYLKSSVGVLRQSFEHYLERDPLLLPGLLFEMRWLGDTHEWDRAKQMVRSTGFGTRWAVLATTLFETSQDAQVFRRQQAYLGLLAADNHPLIRAEAQYKMRELCLAQTARELSKVEGNRARKLLAEDAPTSTFGAMSLRFDNDLFQNGKEDYSVADLEAFISRSYLTM